METHHITKRAELHDFMMHGVYTTLSIFVFYLKCPVLEICQILMLFRKLQFGFWLNLQWSDSLIFLFCRLNMEYFHYSVHIILSPLFNGALYIPVHSVCQVSDNSSFILQCSVNVIHLSLISVNSAQSIRVTINHRAMILNL